MTDQTELKPCPFCGSNELVMLGGASTYMACECGAQGPDRGTDARAITAWNTRLPDAKAEPNLAAAAAPPKLTDKAVESLRIAYVDHDDARDESLAMVLEWYFKSIEVTND